MRGAAHCKKAATTDCDDRNRGQQDRFHRKHYAAIILPDVVDYASRLPRLVDLSQQCWRRRVPRVGVVLLIALAHATGLMRIHFDRRELKDRKERIEQIAKGELVGAATADAVRAAEQAVQAAQAAVMTAIIASTVINSATH